MIAEEPKTKRYSKDYYASAVDLLNKSYYHCKPTKARRLGVVAFRRFPSKHWNKTQSIEGQVWLYSQGFSTV